MRLRDCIRAGQTGKLQDELAKEREPLPAGKYRLELINGVLVEAADDTADIDALELEWKVASGDHSSRRVFQRLKLSSPALAYSVKDLELLGVALDALDSRRLPKLPAEPNRPGERFRAPVPVGIVVGAVLGHWTSQNDGRARHRIERLVKMLKPAPDLSEFDPGPRAAAATTQQSSREASKVDEDWGQDEDENRTGDHDQDEEDADDDSIPF
jgi:hypothetical protein